MTRHVKAEWGDDFFSGLWLDVQRQAYSKEETTSHADFIQKNLQLTPKAKILDVPCGEGRLSIELASRSFR
jgi:cyclopropane fatty-acyl-phospholipid synthase-like methyltransferase